MRYLILSLTIFLSLNVSVLISHAKQDKDVNVVNTPTVEIVNNPALQAVQWDCNAVIPNGQPTLTDTCRIINVPDDKILVIEMVTAQVRLPEGQVPLLNILADSMLMDGSGVASINHIIDLKKTAVSSIPGRDIYQITKKVRIYADAGSTVSIILTRNMTTSTVGVVISLTGHFVDN